MEGYSNCGLLLSSPGRFNRVTFQPVATSALRLEAELPKDATSGIYEWRVNTSEGRQVNAVQEIEPTGVFRLDGDALEWTLEVRNQTGKAIEVGDLAIPLPFNTQYVWDKTTTYTKRLIRHSFIGGSGSYIFWMRSNAAGPYLVMVPEKGTQLEYFDQHRGETFRAYIHSSASGAELAAKGGKWRLHHTQCDPCTEGPARRFGQLRLQVPLGEGLRRSTRGSLRGRRLRCECRAGHDGSHRSSHQFSLRTRNPNSQDRGRVSRSDDGASPEKSKRKTCTSTQSSFPSWARTCSKYVTATVNISRSISS